MGQSVTDSTRKFRLHGWMLLVAVAILLVCGGLGSNKALSQTTPEATPAAQCTQANQFTLENRNNYPIWLGENVGSGPIVEPSLGWKLEAGSSASLCVPPPWVSGRFWARSECDFDDLYQSGTATGSTRANPFTTCNADTDCSGLSGGAGIRPLEEYGYGDLYFTGRMMCSGIHSDS